VRSISWALAVVVLLGCAGTTSREERESSSMAKPPSTEPPQGFPISGFSYPLTGSIRGSVLVEPDGTEFRVTSTSSKNGLDQYYRVEATLDATSRPPVLRCRIHPDESGPTTDLLWGGTAPVAAARVALRDDGGAPWGQLTYDRDAIRVIDPDGKTRVEIVRVQLDAPAIHEGFTVPPTGPGLFHVRVVDANGTPVKGEAVYQP
jgi:hypothetical protein